MHIAQIEITCDSVAFSLKLADKITVCGGDSTTGKTWLSSLLVSWAVFNDIVAMFPRTQCELDNCYNACDTFIVIDRADMFTLDTHHMETDTNQYLVFGRRVHFSAHCNRIILFAKGDTVTGYPI